jgi:phenylpropionate dioxygenase-like ring-hydroxylating dioxygenase large terminal subunit
MLTQGDNELLTRVGSGTPMGTLLRHYWVPVLLASELTPGGKPKRVRLLGEDLIAFRSTRGEPGLLGEFCPHRLASLYFGRIEAAGMRCAYHGWKFGLDGQCLEMPNEPPESTFAAKVRTAGYPCREAGGVIWAYMGPASAPPPMPELEWLSLPADHCFISKRYQACNWFQGLEGGIDSSHISFLHSPLTVDDETVAAIDQASFGIGAAARSGDRAPRFEVVDTDYGVLIGARRSWPDGQSYWRVSQFLLPFYTMPPTDMDELITQSHIWVPMDDGGLINWMVTWHPRRALTEAEIAVQLSGKGSHVVDYAPPTSEPYGDIRPAAHRGNDYGMDWELHRTRMYCGIPAFGVQDQAIQESQGGIVDRGREHLGTSDSAIIHVRRLLIDAAKGLRDRSVPPPGLDSAAYLVRSTSLILPPDADWVEGAMRRVMIRPEAQLSHTRTE